MLEIMLDVNGWQSLFDFQTGESLPADKPYLDIPKRICEAHPYPGDTNKDSIKWTTDVALDIVKEYDPQFFVLSYATGNIIRVNTTLTEEEEHNLSRSIISEAFRFCKEADYIPIIVSDGNLRPFKNVINVDEIEGYFSVASDPYMAGVFGATEKDYETVKNLPGVTYQTKEEFINKYNITDEFALSRTPDIILYSDEHHEFTNIGNRGTVLQRIHKKEKTCSVYTELPGLPDDIFDFRKFVDKELESGKRIAIIIAESTDESDMPDGYKLVNRYRNGIYYMENVSFYYALLNGREFNEVGMPYIYHNPFLKKKPDRRYSFSYIKTDYYQDPIGYNRPFKTASMGTRSGIFHSACMSDYSFECHCRGLAESGLLVFINGDKLGG